MATRTNNLRAAENRRIVLTEVDSKHLLKAYGIPVVAEQTVNSADEAVSAALQIGFPVVLKGVGKKLLHKTEQKLVQLNLHDASSVKSAAAAIADNAGQDLEALLVQPLITGQREFVAGLFRDKLFGPVVLFGLGGVFTEALADITLRLAPLTRSDAEDMLDDINAQKLLGAFRGEPAVNRERLIAILLALSGIGETEPDISEIDINPLIIDDSGDPVAVDALVVKEPNTEAGQAFLPPVDPAILGALFYPQSIAFIGASGHIGKWGYTLLTNTIGGGYAGDIYLVNPKGGTIAGRPVYRSVTDIPGPVDLAVVTVPASLVPDLIPELTAKNIDRMLLIASGFSETGEDGRLIERQLVQQAREAGIYVIGPNTMGIINPHINFYCTGSHVRPTAGTTTVLAQSGNMGNQLLAFAELQRIGIRGFCGSGNEAMITIEDYLDAFEVDPLTETVMLYIESVKNGRRFFESARRLGKKKPIVMLKGGQTRAGNKAAASHTGAMTSDHRVFNALCKQAGIVKVDKSMDLLDLSAAFSALPLPDGNRVAIMTLGGGWGVVTADLCEAYGLDVVPLSASIIATIDRILPPYWSRSNPIDLVGERDLSLPMTVMSELMKWDGCDAVINLGIMGRRHMVEQLSSSVKIADPTCSHEFLDQLKTGYLDFEKKYVRHIVMLMDQYEKPVVGVSMVKDASDHTVYGVDGGKTKGVFFSTPEQAVKSLAKMYEYRRFQCRE